MILIIEGNIDIRENLAELLMMEGFEVETAHSGELGLKLAAELKPDLIICDIWLPIIDGYSVLLALKQNKLTSEIPFIFTSSSSEKIDIKKGLDLGVKYFFVKPFDDWDIIDCIKNCLAANAFK